MRRLSLVWFSCLTALSSSAAVLAAEGRPGGGESPTSTAAPAQAKQAPSPAASPGLQDIYNNFNPDPTQLAYDPLNAWVVAGPKVNRGSPQYVGMAFTPDRDSTVKTISVAVSWANGTNGVTVSLNRDVAGLPGPALYKERVTELPPYGSCCSTSTITAKKGVRVNAGTPYWVVVKTDKATRNTWAFWNDNTIGGLGIVATNSGEGWQAIGPWSIPAFKVMGQ